MSNSQNVSDESESSQNDSHRELLYKVLVVGDIGTGKTSFIKRYVHNIFQIHYKSTIGVDFALKVIKWDDNTNIRLHISDIAGQERYGNMTRAYYKEAVGAFVVFDVTRHSTFDSITKWKSDIDSKVTLFGTSDPIPVVLLANKIDLLSGEDDDNLEWEQKKKTLDNICVQHGFEGWYETSAKDNVGIETCTTMLINALINKVEHHPNNPNNQNNQNNSHKKSIINLVEPQPNNKSCCF